MSPIATPPKDGEDDEDRRKVEGDFSHGTQFGYRRRGCRCDECRAWKAHAARIGRSRRKRDATTWPSWFNPNLRRRGKGLKPRKDKGKRNLKRSSAYRARKAEEDADRALRRRLLGRDGEA